MEAKERIIERNKVLFYAYNGTGLGHLIRLAKIASGLDDSFLPLLVSAHEAIGAIYFDGTEYIRIPDFKTKEISTISASERLAQKKLMLWNIINIYKPKALIIDHLPTGKKEELLELILNYKCNKYLVLRGEIGNKHLVDHIIFTQQNNSLLTNHFDRIFITCDKQISNLDNIESIPQIVKSKFYYTGYVALKIDAKTIENIRKKFLKKGKKWVICSAGGGKLGDELIKTCISLSMNEKFKNYQFDIIYGFYSSLKWDYEPYNTVEINTNIRLSRNLSNLYFLHASADMVICSGGYNTLTEALQGMPKQIYSYSVQTESNEQKENIKKLKEYYPITEIDDLSKLEEMMLNDESSNMNFYNCLDMISFDGIENINNQIINDLCSQII
jgi:predicted glycosyltransferase